MIRLPLVELLAGVAEGACELGQAALKLRKALPADKQEAIDRFDEALADLELYLDSINYNRRHVNEIKEARMDARGSD